MSASPSALERLLRHDRNVVIGALVVVTLLAWIYTVTGVGMMMSAIEMSPAPWETGQPQVHAAMPMTGLKHLLLLTAMWWVMMVAMMLPSAAPVILLTAALNRRSLSGRPPYGSTASFTIGYLLVWLLFSVLATAAQHLLASSGLLSGLMQSNSEYLTAGLLLAAGAWQFTSIKQACLRHCRSPIEFVTRHRRPGNGGALLMGIHHGSYCLGCCWFLMALLFVGGVMNLFWIVGLVLFVLLEKLIFRGKRFSYAAGAGLMIAAAAVLIW